MIVAPLASLFQRVEVFSWPRERPESVFLLASLAVFTVTLLFLFFHTFTQTVFFRQVVRRWSGASAPVYEVLIARWFGSLCYGLVPLALAVWFWPGSLADYGLSFESWQTSLVWAAFGGALAAMVNYWNAGRPQNLRRYPKIRTRYWPLGLRVHSALSWVVYLMAYEFMMRGFLLFTCYHALGFWPAVLINISLYALIHLPEGVEETLGSLPFGVLLSALSLVTGSFLATIVIHVALALSSEWFSIQAYCKKNEPL